MLKRLKIEDGSFEANGRKYFVETSISTGRFKEYQKLQHHVGFGVDFMSQYKTLTDVYDLLNKQKFADAAVRIHNTINGITKALDDRQHPALLMCTLFMNREGEDLSSWSEEDAVRKIEDWNKEGFDVQDFFSFAVSTVSGLFLAYEELTQTTLETIQEELNTTTSESST